MKTTKQTRTRYPWGATCPVFWPRAYAVVACKGWNQAFSKQTMDVLALYCPFMEVRSSGEIILDLTRQQKSFGSPVKLVNTMLNSIPAHEREQIQIGLAGDAMAAWLAARVESEKSVRIIPVWDSERVLASMAVDVLDELAMGMSLYLKELNIDNLADLKTLPAHYLTGRFGNLGKAVLLLAQGKPVPMELWNTQVPGAITMGGSLSSRSTERQAATLFNTLYSRLQQTLDKRHYQHGRLVMEQVMESGEVKRTVLRDGDSVELLLSASTIQLRLSAMQLKQRSIQGDLFAFLAPVKQMMAGIAAQMT